MFYVIINIKRDYSQWGDLLTSYNGTAITYDAIGNPLSYYNGTAYTFTWEGRRLVGAVKGSSTMSFEYNDEGIRTSKTVNGVETVYYVNGSQIVAEKTGTRTIAYIYDASGTPIGMMYRTTSYAENVWDVFWYEKNLQGDIIAVYNSTGTKVATYTYSDAWGNHTVSYSNGGASTGVVYNPFRYRSYYYDKDLGMYYLQSRYYDAKICRFISADYASVITATPYALTDKNLYAYCDNNPVNRIDSEGNFWSQFVIGAVIGLAGGIIDQIQSGEEWTVNAIAKIAVSTISGGITAVVGPITGIIISGIAGGINSYLSYNDNEQILADALSSSLSAAIGCGAQLLVGRVLAGSFIKNASKTKLKTFANSLGYVGIDFKTASSWSGEIMFSASVSYMKKPASVIVGDSTSFIIDRLISRYSD